MLETLTRATFRYNKYFTIATPVYDSLSGKFFGWSGHLDNLDDLVEQKPIAAKSIVKFEEQFKLLVDSLTLQADSKVMPTTNSLADDVAKADKISPEMSW